MILLNKKALWFVPVFVAYIGLILFCIERFDANILRQVFADKVFVYLIVPPFVCGTSMIEESMKKPSLTRMKSRKQAVLFLLFQQYLLAIGYLLTWFMLIAAFVKGYGGNVEVADFVVRYVRYLLCLVLFVNVAGCFKRINNKMLATIPFIATYVVMIIDVLAITSITGKAFNIIYVMFAWTFCKSNVLSIAVLVIFVVASYLMLVRLDRKADFY